MKIMKKNYGNWIPERMLKLLWTGAAILAIALIAEVIMLNLPIVSGLITVFLVVTIAMATYMQICHHLFSFSGGGVMEKIHEFVISKMNWDGKGTLLDIGCGSGALSIRCAKLYPNATIMGIDYWGKEWNYAKDQCETNATLEKVSSSITFMKGDAAKLPFEDGTFDAAISNFVFHEVRTQPQKQLVVREALRVVKKGGYFAFHDLFENKAFYGNMEEFVEGLRKEGITELQYIPHTERLPLVPGFTKAPWMLTDLGLLYGRK